MSKLAKFNDVLTDAINSKAYKMPLINAEVVSVQGESCTILINGLEIDGVRLKATINQSENKIIIKPKIGSIVLVGSLSNDLRDLAVIGVDEVEKLTYTQDGLVIEIDSTDKKIKIENEDTSLKKVLQQLSNLLKSFKVFTPSGPSGTPLPTTISNINSFENDFKKILK